MVSGQSVLIVFCFVTYSSLIITFFESLVTRKQEVVDRKNTGVRRTPNYYTRVLY